jgi:hypothetical protein
MQTGPVQLLLRCQNLHLPSSKVVNSSKDLAISVVLRGRSHFRQDQPPQRWMKRLKQVASRDHLSLDAEKVETRCRLKMSASDTIHSLLPGLRVKLVWQQTSSLSTRSLTALVLPK